MLRVEIRVVFDVETPASLAFDEEEIQVIQGALRFRGQRRHFQAGKFEDKLGCAGIFALADEIDGEEWILKGFEIARVRPQGLQNLFEGNVLMAESFPS